MGILFLLNFTLSQQGKNTQRAPPRMRTDSFSPDSLRAAYHLAAEINSANFQEFAEQSKVFDFAVTSLGAGLLMNVECDTRMPVSTPAELVEKKTQRILAKSQKKANLIADKQRRIQEALAKKMTRKMQKEIRAKK
jgi:hypothetical protein